MRVVMPRPEMICCNPAILASCEWSHASGQAAWRLFRRERESFKSWSIVPSRIGFEANGGLSKISVSVSDKGRKRGGCRSCGRYMQKNLYNVKHEVVGAV